MKRLPVLTLIIASAFIVQLFGSRQAFAVTCLDADNITVTDVATEQECTDAGGLVVAAPDQGGQTSGQSGANCTLITPSSTKEEIDAYIACLASQMDQGNQNSSGNSTRDPIAPVETDLCKVPGASGSTFCNTQDASNGNATSNPIVGPGGILTVVVDLLTLITGIISTIVIVLSGLMYAFSNGDASRAGQARSSIIYASVALVVVLISRSILVFVIDRLNI